MAVRICMYVWQLYYYIRSIVRYIYDHANIGSKMGRLISLFMHALVTRTHVLDHILFLDAFSSITTVSFSPRIDYLFLQRCLIPVITARKKSSGKSHGDPGKHSKPSEETTSNVGYVSHRQAWAERKKKKSRDRVSWSFLCRS